MKNQNQANLSQKHHQRLIDEESDIRNQALIQLHLMEPIIPIDLEKGKGLHEVIIDETPVYFPHKPYEVQIEYMKTLIKALDKKQNALLESPTGTGKTLSTLCASLAWLKKYRSNKTFETSEQTGQLKIIYSSRTHAQLNQVAKELKNTVYKPNVAILGSRDQYCIRGDLRDIKGVALNQICKKEILSHKCSFNRMESCKLIQLAKSHSKLLHSLEEGKKFGYENQCCPYYFEKERSKNADLILLPYNYLLNKNLINIVDIENSILIFDEAHNVQNSAEDGSSFMISLVDVLEAEKELKKWIQELENPEFHLEPELKSILPDVNECKSIEMTIKMFGIYLNEQKNTMKPKEKVNDDTFIIKNGREIFVEIEKNTRDQQTQSRYKNGLNSENITTYINHSQQLINIMGQHSSTQGNQFETWTKFIENISDLLVLDILAQIQFESIESLENPVNQYKLAFQLNKNNELSFHMWCLDPSLAFNRLLKKNIHSIILTSGTLAPLDSWTYELRVDFPIRLQNKHVINIQQNLRVFQNKSFDFSFKQRNNEEQINKLGISLLNLCRVIPNGILVIFSSYDLMNKLKSKWKYSKILLRIQEIKACLWEINQSVEMQNVFEIFKQKAKKGAIMFAVQRGKVAEGVDFPDELCRAVFLIGVPYPSSKDQKVGEKKNYLKNVYKYRKQGLNDQEWYNQQATRATNQALGRVIRHVNDYGVVFLCDKRFQNKPIFSGLSEWVKPAIRQWLDDDEVSKKTKEFFKRDYIILRQSENMCDQQQISRIQESQSSLPSNRNQEMMPTQTSQIKLKKKPPIILRKKTDAVSKTDQTNKIENFQEQGEHQQVTQKEELLSTLPSIRNQEITSSTKKQPAIILRKKRMQTDEVIQTEQTNNIQNFQEQGDQQQITQIQQLQSTLHLQDDFTNRNISEQLTQFRSQPLINSNSDRIQKQYDSNRPHISEPLPNLPQKIYRFFASGNQESLDYFSKQIPSNLIYSYIDIQCENSQSSNDQNDEESQLSNENIQYSIHDQLVDDEESQMSSINNESQQSQGHEDLYDSYDEESSQDYQIDEESDLSNQNYSDSDEWQQKKKQKYNYPYQY